MFKVGDKVYVADEEHPDSVGIIVEDVGGPYCMYLVEINEELLIFAPQENISYVH